MYIKKYKGNGYEEKKTEKDNEGGQFSIFFFRYGMGE